MGRTLARTHAHTLTHAHTHTHPSIHTYTHTHTHTPKHTHLHAHALRHATLTCSHQHIHRQHNHATNMQNAQQGLREGSCSVLQTVGDEAETSGCPVEVNRFVDTYRNSKAIIVLLIVLL